MRRPSCKSSEFNSNPHYTIQIRIRLNFFWKSTNQMEILQIAINTRVQMSLQVKAKNDS